MTASLYIAWRYLVFNKLRSATIVACVTLIAVVPLALQLLLDESEQQLLSRASSTPLLVGARGSALDLVMNSLYFDDEIPELVSMASSRRVLDSGLATPIPIHARFRARDLPIVGTSIEYFDLRGLSVRDGRSLAILGECVLGATAAERLSLAPGDTIVSSPESLFDLAGVYPLRMKVVGVLERNHSPDDLAVFVDVKTAWVIEGLGHGHDDLREATDPTLVLERQDDSVAVSAKLPTYNEITAENLHSFHFHGDPATYPLTAVIAVANDRKSGTILRGRYVAAGETEQIVVPAEVVDGLLQSIFRVKNIMDAVVVLVAAATVLAIVLVFALSLRLRQSEFDTIFKLGSGRLTVVRLMAAEILIIGLVSAVLCAVLLWLGALVAPDLIRALIIRL